MRAIGCRSQLVNVDGDGYSHVYGFCWRFQGSGVGRGRAGPRFALIYDPTSFLQVMRSAWLARLAFASRRSGRITRLTFGGRRG